MSAQSLLDDLRAINVQALSNPALSISERLSQAEMLRKELQLVKREFAKEEKSVESSWDARRKDEALQEKRELLPYKLLQRVIDGVSFAIDTTLESAGLELAETPSIPSHIYGAGDIWQLGNEQEYRSWAREHYSEMLQVRHRLYLLDLDSERGRAKDKLELHVSQLRGERNEFIRKIAFGACLIAGALLYPFILTITRSSDMYFEPSIRWIFGLSLLFSLICPIALVLALVTSFSFTISSIRSLVQLPVTLRNYRETNKKVQIALKQLPARIQQVDAHYDGKVASANAKLEQTKAEIQEQFRPI